MNQASEKKERGVPPWVMTFADLMTLLMCFFVLLLAFSEMDVLKFKQLSGSMKNAFGVQTEVKAKQIPKGTSVVAREFSPGRPDPTSIPTVRQFTIDSNQSTLDLVERRDQEMQKALEDVEREARRIRTALAEEIARGSVAVETEGVKIVIRIKEKASFDSGRAEVRPGFAPVLQKIGAMINDNSGLVNVSGHTDDVPIAASNTQFRSNWELSTSRAVSVTHELLKATAAKPRRFTVTGHADTRPRADNLTAENRAKNRRVDISIIRGAELDPVSEVSIGGSDEPAEDDSAELPAEDASNEQA